MYFEFLFLSLPALLIAAASYLIHRALTNQREFWIKTTVSIILLIVVALAFLVVGAESGFLSWVLIFPSALAIGTAFFAGLWLVIEHRNRKRVGIVIGFFYSLLLLAATYAGMMIGIERSPESRTEDSGNELILALQQYRTDEGRYPVSLDELVPTYIEEIPPVRSAAGVPWLYTTTGDGFVLGYMRFPEKLGNDVCQYKSDERIWNCKFNEWGPFTPIPTYFLTPTPQARQ